MGRVARRRAFACLAVAGLCAVACAGTPDRSVIHTLKPGENLYRLSKYYGVPVRDIERANGIRDATSIRAGTRLRIPGATRAPAGEPLALASYAPPAPDVSARARRDSKLDFVWPVHGSLTSRYGWRRKRMHEGIDISAKRGTKVRAAEAGRVIYSGKMGGYGRIVIIKHAGRYSTVYAHNRKNRVSEGQFVEKGDVVAEVGTTGNSSGPHLHFEVRRDRKHQDPMAHLP